MQQLSESGKCEPCLVQRRGLIKGLITFFNKVAPTRDASTFLGETGMAYVFILVVFTSSSLVVAVVMIVVL